MLIRPWVATASIVIFLPGCVERLLRVRSDPVGAEVWVNGESVGQTPLEHPFTFHGTVGIVVRSSGHESRRVLVRLAPPWYERFPLDFFAEHLVPWTMTDAHDVKVTLPRLESSTPPQDREQFEPKIEAARERLRRLREDRDARAAARSGDSSEGSVEERGPETRSEGQPPTGAR
jgi:hypothetical protein